MGGKAWAAPMRTGGPVLGPEVPQSSPEVSPTRSRPTNTGGAAPDPRSGVDGRRPWRTWLRGTSQRRVLVDPEMREFPAGAEPREQCGDRRPEESKHSRREGAGPATNVNDSRANAIVARGSVATPRFRRVREKRAGGRDVEPRHSGAAVELAGSSWVHLQEKLPSGMHRPHRSHALTIATHAVPGSQGSQDWPHFFLTHGS